MDAFICKPFDVEEAVRVILRLAPAHLAAEPAPDDGASSPAPTTTAPPPPSLPGLSVDRSLAIWKDPDTVLANKNKRFYLNDPGNVDWDWLRPRYRQLREKGNIKYLPANN